MSIAEIAPTTQRAKPGISPGLVPLDLKIREGIGLFNKPQPHEVTEVIHRLHLLFDKAVNDETRESCGVIAYCISVAEIPELEADLITNAYDRPGITTLELAVQPPDNELWAGTDAKRSYRIHRFVGPLALVGPQTDDLEIVSTTATYAFHSSLSI